MLTFGSLFAGIGGIDLGFERAGMKCVWQVENNEYAIKILEKHWPDVKRYKDITKTDFTKVDYVDIICGGFPCQDISNAGKREGIKGQRSGLWKEFFRAICEIRPKYAVVENVSALINNGLDTVLADLASCGYDARWDCIPASSVGAPHRRDRVFIVAHTKRYGSHERDRKKVNSRETKKEHPDISCSTGSGRGNEDVANTDNRLEQEHEIQTGRNAIKLGSQDMANTDSTRIQRNNKKESSKWKQKTEFKRRSDIVPDTDYYCWKQRRESIQKENRRKYWATDAGILRVANGIPNRVHRIRCLGNAVVPQVAEFIGKIIVEFEKNEIE